MKVKNEAYLRSLTALLRSTLKNSIDAREKCDSWVATVPSVTYIWTRRPQWRRRHKNRKKAQVRGFILPSMVTWPINENDLHDTLKPLGTLSSRSSFTYPYEENFSSGDDKVSKSMPSYRLYERLRNQSFSALDHKSTSYTSQSAAGSEFITWHECQEIRSSASIQNTKRNPNTNKFMDESVENYFRSDCGIPKRHVTFSDYASANTVIDENTSDPIIEIINDDNNLIDDHSWQQINHENSDDNFSLQSELSLLLSSVIFEESKSSLSLTSSQNLEKRKISKRTLMNRENYVTFFYVNSLYTNRSSSDVISLSEISNLIESNKVTKMSTHKLPYNPSIECITIDLKHISSSVKELSVRLKNDSDKLRPYSSLLLNKHHISTDTRDIITCNLIPSFESTELLKVRQIFNYRRQPRDQADGSCSPKQINCEKPMKSDGDENLYKTMNNVNILRVDAESHGERETIFIEIKEFSRIFGEEEQIRCHLNEICEKFDDKIVSFTSNVGNENAKCEAQDHNKCCLICGRTKTENPRYFRPLCRVKGAYSTARLENDPWIKNELMKKAVVVDNKDGVQIIPLENTMSKDQLCQEQSKGPSNKENEISTVDEFLSAEEEECLSITITELENPCSSIVEISSHIKFLSSREQSTNCSLPEPDFWSSSSLALSTRYRGRRSPPGNKVFLEESSKRGPLNRLLRVNSESDSLMAIPPLLPKKLPDWFCQRLPRRKFSRR